jgi:5-methylcytosine-specific restriction enzyme subunit McrC
MNFASRTIRLRERQTRLYRLRRADVEFLVAQHPQHLDVEFTPDRNWYRLTPRGVAGVIAAPTCKLWILPKLPWDNFARLLDPAQQWFKDAPRAICQSPRGLPDFLIDRFVHLLRLRISEGLIRGYTERFEVIGQVRGRIDVAAQLRIGPGLPQRFACHFDELSIDIPCNRLLKAIGERLLASAWLNQRVRPDLQSLLRNFAATESVSLSLDAFAEVLADPRAADYRPLIELGHMLLAACSLGHGEICSAFLFDMERAFERYVTLGLQRLLADSDASIEAQPTVRWHEYDAGQPELYLRPDVVIRNQSGHSVIEVKWKEFTGQPDTDDLHQILAYTAALKARRAVLVFPGRQHQTRTYHMLDRSTQVQFTTLRMTGSQEQCERSLRRLARRITSARTF